MASTFISRPADVDLTSRIGSIKVRTDLEKADISIVRDPDGDIDEFFTTTLYSVDGIIELQDVGTLIEEQLRIKNRSWNMIAVTIGDVTTEFTAIYCEWILDVDFDHTDCFWSIAASDIVHYDSNISLAHWPTGSSSYLVRVIGHDAEGNLSVVERMFDRPATALWAHFSVPEITSFALGKTADAPEVPLSKIAYFTISYGKIQKAFFLIDEPYYLEFRFRNIFNAPEYVDIAGIVNRKTAADRETAIIDGCSRHYNRVISRTYDFTSAPLTPERAALIEQMLTSYQVELVTHPDDYKILITDFTSEVSNDDESLITMKFTFRFANNRPTLFDSDMGALLPDDTRIFTDEFTEEYT